MKQIVGVILTLLFFYPLLTCAAGSSKAKSTRSTLIGIIVPMEEESELLIKNIRQHKKLTIDGVKYEVGKLADRDIVFVNSGIGKVNSAVVTSRLIRDFHPGVILLSGSAGNLNSRLKEGEVVVGRHVVDVDMGELTSTGTRFKYKQCLDNPQTGTTQPLIIELDKKLIDVVSQLPNNHLPKIIAGKIATSDALPNQTQQVSLLRNAKFDVVEMEGASFMQVCWFFDTPCVVIRGVSNNVEDKITHQDIVIAADNAAKVTMQLIKHMPDLSS